MRIWIWTLIAAAALCLTACLQDPEDPRPGPPGPGLDSGVFDPGKGPRRDPGGYGYGSGGGASGYGAGVGGGNGAGGGAGALPGPSPDTQIFDDAEPHDAGE